MSFKLQAPYTPTGDQPHAIDTLVQGIHHGLDSQVLLGVTGSGKTFTMANVIQKLQRPTLIISHNKTLAAQLYQEFRSFFPNNAVCYFVSYYDYYQPEAYIPSTDTYIEKETEINEEIDKLRLSSTANLLTRSDTIIIASVSCIYNIGSPKEYGNFVLELRKGMRLSRQSIASRLVDLQYGRADYGFHRGSFRVRGDIIDISLAYEDIAIRITQDDDKITSLTKLDPLTGKIVEETDAFVVYPAKHYMADPKKTQDVMGQIRQDLDERVKFFKDHGKLVEAYRLNQKVTFDLEMIQEVGYVNGIENYSRYFDGRKPGDPPYSLLEYFNQPYGKEWLLFIDESHMTMPQIRGMYNGDRARKETLINFGFRLPAAFDNRPLTFTEFMQRTPQTIYVTATPNEWELSRAKETAHNHPFLVKHLPHIDGSGKEIEYTGVIEQLIRPTGIIDPKITIRPSEGQIPDLVREIVNRKRKGQRVLVTTLTKRMSEDLASYMNDKKYMEIPEFSLLTKEEQPIVHYLHADVETLERSDILDDLRLGKYDVVIGINLLREGLDLPEVSLVAILDADKEGFLRSETSLVQTMGRAARHIHGEVVMYADRMTGSMERAIKEIDRRRSIQDEYNKKHGTTPTAISKPIRDKLVEKEDEQDDAVRTLNYLDTKKMVEYRNLLAIDADQLPPRDKSKFIKKLETEMRAAAGDLNFELAAEIRDKIKTLKRG